MAKKVPVTILTGFLGSGKTTLLNRILTDQSHHIKIAVIENEFGDQIGVERLIARGSNDSNADDLFVEMTNGCICCSVKNDLVLTIEAFLKRKQNLIDHIIIETSGLADVSPLIQTFWLDSELESQVYLNGVITIVDSNNFLRILDGKSSQGDHDKLATLARRQVGFADLILLNKTDLTNETQLGNLDVRIREINPLAVLKQVSLKSDENLNWLSSTLQIRSFDSEIVEAEIKELNSLSSSKKQHNEHGNENHAHEVHDDNVKSIIMAIDDPVNLEEFKRWFGELLWEKSVQTNVEIFRAKGIVQVQNSAKMYILQSVGDTFEIYESNQTFPEDGTIPTKTKIIFIGRNLDQLNLPQ